MKLNLTEMDTDASANYGRPLTCEVNLLSQSDGSASFSQGDSNALAAVYGPAEVKIAKELIDKATIEVVYKPKSGLPGCEDKFMERLVRNTCESLILTDLHPRTLITVIIQEMQNSGSYLACCINAACLSLLDSCVPMQYSVAAVCCIIDSQGKMIIDPTRKQEKTAKSSFTFVFESKHRNVITLSTIGIFSPQEHEECLHSCRQASSQIFNFYRETMKKKLSKKQET